MSKGYYIMSGKPPPFLRGDVMRDGWGPVSYQKTALTIARTRAIEGRTSWVVKMDKQRGVQGNTYTITVIAKVEP